MNLGKYEYIGINHSFLYLPYLTLPYLTLPFPFSFPFSFPFPYIPIYIKDFTYLYFLPNPKVYLNLLPIPNNKVEQNSRTEQTEQTE